MVFPPTGGCEDVLTNVLVIVASLTGSANDVLTHGRLWWFMPSRTGGCSSVRMNVRWWVMLS